MKKIFAFFGIVCGMWGAAMAQNVTIAKGDPGKEVDEEMVSSGWYLGQHGTNDCWLMRTEDGPKSFVRSDDWQVVEVDRNLRVHGRLELPMTRMCAVVTARKKDQMADVILVDSSDSRSLTLLKVRVDLDQMMLVGHKMDTLDRFTKEPTDKSYVWGAVSGNGEYMGVLTLLQYTKKLQYVAEASLYDGEMEEMWRKEYAVGTTSSMAVSDRGEMVTLGYDDVSDGVRFTINIIGARTGDTYGLTMDCDRIVDMQIANILNNKVVCTGLFSPLQSNPKDKIIGGTVSMAFDLDADSLTGFTLRPFQNEDVNILTNNKTKKVQHEQEVSMVVPIAIARMPYGAVMAVGHRHVTRYVNANGTIETSYYVKGVHLVAVDENGGVMWTKNIRRNDMQKGSDEKLYVALFPVGGTLCLIKTEHPKYPAGYDIAKAAKEYEAGDKGNLVLYRVNETGDADKVLLEKKNKHVLTSAAKRGDNEVVMLTLDGKKSRMVELTIEN